MDLNHHTTGCTLCAFTFSRSHTYAVPLHRRSLLRTFLVDSNHPGSFRRHRYKLPLRPNAWEGGVTHTLQKYLGGLGLLICYLVTILRQVLHGLPAVISGSAFQLNISFERSSEEVREPCTTAHPSNGVCYDRLMRPVYIGLTSISHTNVYVA